jgi:hypothetical protein
MAIFFFGFVNWDTFFTNSYMFFDLPI